MITMKYTDLVAKLRRLDASCNNMTDAHVSDILTMASQRLWERVIPIVETIQSGTLAVASGGIIDPADVGYGSWLIAFTTDPRPPGTAYQIVSTSPADTTGIRAQTTGTTVYAFWRKTYPLYSGTAFDNGATYVPWDVMLYTDGLCYRCTAATSAGQDPVDTPAKWELQPVLLRSAAALIYYAIGITKGEVNESDLDSRNFQTAERLLMNEKLLFSQNYPWLTEAGAARFQAYTSATY